jgi:hypothetical protein
MFYLSIVFLAVKHKGKRILMSETTVLPTEKTNATSATNTVPKVDTILTLLDQMNLNVVLHTHHPLTHLEYPVATAPETNVRYGCPETPAVALGGISG